MKKKITAMLCFCFILVAMFTVAVNAAELEKIEANKIEMGPLVATRGETGYNCYVSGDAVNFRSSPYLLSNNIIRTLYTGHRLWMNVSGMNIAYNNGKYWSYVKDIKNGDWGYMASDYFHIQSSPPRIAGGR